MRAAIVHAGTVENVIIVGDSFAPGPDRQLVALANDSPVGPGWSHDGETFAPPFATVPVPQSVTARQARLALLAAGLLSSVEQGLAALPGPQGEAARIEWEYALEIRRDSPLLSAIGMGLGFTEAQIDALFLAASAL